MRSLRRCSWSEGGQLLTDHMPRVLFAIGSLAVVLGVGHEWGRKWGTQGEARGPLRSWGGTRVLQGEASPSATGRAASMTSLSIVLFSFSSVLPFGTSVKQLEETPEEGRSWMILSIVLLSLPSVLLLVLLCCREWGSLQLWRNFKPCVLCQTSFLLRLAFLTWESEVVPCCSDRLGSARGVLHSNCGMGSQA